MNAKYCPLCGALGDMTVNNGITTCNFCKGVFKLVTHNMVVLSEEDYEGDLYDNYRKGVGDGYKLKAKEINDDDDE
jgi:hypothetical protein